MKSLHIEQPSSTINVHNTLTSNIIHENILMKLENTSPHCDKYFQQLLDTPIHPCDVLSSIVFLRKKKIKIKSMIEKYSLHDPP
jgi:hypothetical protein